MPERYCSTCGKHIECREEKNAIPDTTRLMVRLSCPDCGKALGLIYDEDLRITPTFPVSKG